MSRIIRGWKAPRRRSHRARTARVALLVGAPLLAGCILGVDADQARQCRRVLPALNPGAAIVVERVQAGDGGGSVAIAYRTTLDGAAVQRSIQCRFAADGLAARKADLVGLETEDGPVSGASLYLLKRYYLDTPEGTAGDPGAGDLAAGLPEVPSALAYGLQHLVSGLPRSAIYGLIAAAYALVFGLAGRINLAFGEITAIGAAATVAGVGLMLSFGAAEPLAALPLGIVAACFAGAMHGFAAGWLGIAAVRGRQASLIATVGLSLVLMEALRLAQSPVPVWLPPVFAQSVPVLRAGTFVVTLTPVSLLTAGLGLLAAGGLVVWLQVSSFGRAWRACADDPVAASLLGVDGRRLLAGSLALAGAAAGLAGLLIVVQYGGLGFAGGFQFGLKALIAAVLGGIGSVPGALVGGLAIGAFETIWSALLPIEGRDIALFAALVVVLVLRPGGLFGFGEGAPRRI